MIGRERICLWNIPKNKSKYQNILSLKKKY